MPKVSRANLKPETGALVVIDLQTSLMPHIFEGDRVLDRVAFLAKIARLLEIPVFATEQNPSRMGLLDSRLNGLVADPFPKMSFGAGGCPEFMEALANSGRRQVVLVGVETHICVSLTAHDLQDAGYEVVVCPDAVSSRSVERHKLGMERIRDAGIVPAHTESVAYEWLGTAENPHFRKALRIVKDHP